MKRLLLAGGGHAHVHVLAALARAPLAGADVTLVTPFRRQMYSGMLPGWVAGHYALDQIVIPLPALAAAARVRLVESHIVALDAAARRATLADGQVLDYDLLSLDTGPVMDRDLIPGARAHALFLRPVEHFVVLFEQLLARAAKAPLDLAVVGGGAAGVEVALALAWRLQQMGSASRLSLVSGAEGPLAGFAEGVKRPVRRALQARRVTLLPQDCQRIQDGGLTLAGGTRLACDMPLLAIGTSAPAWLRGSGLALDDRGFVATGPTLQSLSHPEVFAAGDVATRSDAPHPKSGVYAVRAGPPLALNLRRAIAGEALQPYMPQRRTLYLLSTGARHAVASWGRWSTSGRWVWWWKDHIDRGFVARYAGRP